MNKTTNILLTVSIGVNCLLAGLVIGNISSHSKLGKVCRNKMGHHHHHGKMGAGHFLPEMKEMKHEFHDEIKAARQEVFKTLVADEFDPNLYQAKADALHQSYRKVAEKMTSHIKQKAQTLDKQERRAMARALRKHMRHKMHHH